MLKNRNNTFNNAYRVLQKLEKKIKKIKAEGKDDVNVLKNQLN